MEQDKNTKKQEPEQETAQKFSEKKQEDVQKILERIEEKKKSEKDDKSQSNQNNSVKNTQNKTQNTGNKTQKIGKTIFISLGTHPQQFERLLWEVERLIDEGSIRGEVFCQTGHTKYEPKNFGFKKFIAPDIFKQHIKECDIFITHAGEGNIGLAKNMGKKLIAVPRKKEFDEHTNDHQLELAKVVEEKKLGLVSWIIWDLGDKIKEIEKFEPETIKRGNISEILENYVDSKLGW